MSAEAGEKVFVVKFRGGPADGVYRLARGRVPAGVVVERDGEQTPYVYAFEEPQARDAYTFDHATKQTVRTRVVEAHYQIFVPEGRGGAR